MAEQNFQVDLQGIIKLLSENLYSSEDVFVRELLQNAVDATNARIELEVDFQPEVVFSFCEEGDVTYLTVRDNGIGLTKEEIHSFLSVIGSSSKRAEDARATFIGQFGIGLLSCFLVTDTIKVNTRSVKEDKSYTWVGQNDGTYKVTTDRKSSPRCGTCVTIALKGALRTRYSRRKIEELLGKYAFLLPTPVFIEMDGKKKKINDTFIPWRQPLSTRDDMLEFGRLVFEEEFFDVIPLHGEYIQGYAFVTLEPVNANAVRRHKIFLKNMYVTEDGSDLIPDWSFFTRCFINTRDLVPVASREGFSKDHKLLKAKKEIEQNIYDYLVQLVTYDVNRLKTITSVHSVGIKMLSVQNENVYKLFFPFMTFSTNKGMMTGAQLVKASQQKNVYYVVELDDFQRIAPLLTDSKNILINGGYIYDSTLIQRVKKINKSIEIPLFEDSSYSKILDSPTEEIEKAFRRVMDMAEDALTAVRCTVEMKSFMPASLPALYIPNENMEMDEDFGSGLSDYFEGFSFDEVFEEEMEQNKLFLNSNNEIVKNFLDIQNAELAASTIRLLYVQALLTGRYTLSDTDIELMNQSFADIMNRLR